MTDTKKLPISTPILEDKDFEAPSVFEPENLLREARRQKGLSDVKAPDVCILDPDGDIVRALRKSGRARKAIGWACYHTELDEFDLDGECVGIVGCAVGASFAVLVAEELFASGCRLLLSVTSAGQIVASGPLPYFILIDRALRDEGTSYHYRPPAEFSTADTALADLVMRALSGIDLPIYQGAVWTTDAPFRETAPAIAAARERGLLAVEMEAAALYAFAEARRKPVLCFAHVTNQMAVAEGDFEKGEADGANASLRLVAAAARAWRNSAGEMRGGGRSARGDGEVGQGAQSAPSNQAMLFSRLKALGIATTTVDYPAHRTVEEGRALRGTMPGCFTKNLLLRDKKERLFLVVAHEDRALDLKVLHKQVGASGRLGFAPPDEMKRALGVEPGALTPLALFLDRERRVTPVIDAALMREAQLNFHPLVNTRSTGISAPDLLRFIKSCGRKAMIVRLASEETGDGNGPELGNVISSDEVSL